MSLLFLVSGVATGYLLERQECAGSSGGAPRACSCLRRAHDRHVLLRDLAYAAMGDSYDPAISGCAVAGNYVDVHAGGKVHLIRESLTRFIAPLDTLEFLRVHRSHVVRLGFIAELRPMFHADYQLVLRDGQTLPFSQAL